MTNYKIGEMMTLYADVELKDFLGDKTLEKKGTKISEVAIWQTETIWED